MRFSGILFALPLAQSIVAAPLLGGLLGGGNGGLLGGGGSAPATETGSEGGALAVFEVVDKLKGSITDMIGSHPSLETGTTDKNEILTFLASFSEAIEGTLSQLTDIKRSASTKRDFADEEAAENNATALAQIVDSIEDIVTKLSEDVKADQVVGRLLTTIDNNLFLTLQAVEQIVPGTLDRVDKILDRLDGTVDRVLDLVDGLLG